MAAISCETIKAGGAEVVTPPRPFRKVIIPQDAAKHRNRIERCFNRLKHFRHFAFRGEY